MSSNITWHDTSITKEDYRKKNKHSSGVIWLTGLSGSGKSTIANIVNQKLFEKGLQTYVLDGDNVRHGLNKDLGFGDRDREENIRRVGEVAKLFADSGTIVLASFISPFRSDRDQIRASLTEGEFVEVYVDCPLQECEKRDPKGIYKKVRNGEIPSFTGIDSPYEAPQSSELVIRTEQESAKESADKIIQFLQERNWI
ncbi:adenylyl-sulfate kinase [Halobacillus andaensis]|uniref:Adenylyl-sulfate kinase n=1 Tax=Halobacillus andaensis TaxID=1176239 RepID=A0A917B603_HALAA|nr:adenylyl-sulfate kinase [Halobacillus andaensis]MBP2005790.1 adenylylsulfate kinase [Halobacillus andaensis]GGF26046.1 adenylyl-sulfate kinase [Halobacillus andaensis]